VWGIAKGLAAAGARVAVADLRFYMAETVASAIGNSDGAAKAYEVDAFSRSSIEACCDKVYDDFGRVDILVNGVGGNMKGATTSPEQSFFDIPADAIQKVVDLNLVAGAIVPSQVFVKRMKDNPSGLPSSIYQA